LPRGSTPPDTALRRTRGDSRTSGRGYSRLRAATCQLDAQGRLRLWADVQQLASYADDYHGLDKRLKAAVPGSEMISEVYS